MWTFLDSRSLEGAGSWTCQKPKEFVISLNHPPGPASLAYLLLSSSPCSLPLSQAPRILSLLCLNSPVSKLMTLPDFSSLILHLPCPPPTQLLYSHGPLWLSLQ